MTQSTKIARSMSRILNNTKRRSRKSGRPFNKACSTTWPHNCDSGSSLVMNLAKSSLRLLRPQMPLLKLSTGISAKEWTKKQVLKKPPRRLSQLLLKMLTRQLSRHLLVRLLSNISSRIEKQRLPSTC